MLRVVICPWCRALPSYAPKGDVPWVGMLWRWRGAVPGSLLVTTSDLSSSKCEYDVMEDGGSVAGWESCSAGVADCQRTACREQVVWAGAPGFVRLC